MLTIDLWSQPETTTPEQRLWYAVLLDALRRAVKGDLSERDWWMYSRAVDDICLALGLDPGVARASARRWWERADEERNAGSSIILDRPGARRRGRGGIDVWFRRKILVDLHAKGLRDVGELAGRALLSNDDATAILHEEGLPYERVIGYTLAGWNGYSARGDRDRATVRRTDTVDRRDGDGQGASGESDP